MESHGKTSIRIPHILAYKPIACATTVPQMAAIPAGTPSIIKRLIIKNCMGINEVRWVL